MTLLHQTGSLFWKRQPVINEHNTDQIRKMSEKSSGWQFGRKVDWLWIPSNSKDRCIGQQPHGKVWKVGRNQEICNTQNRNLNDLDNPILETFLTLSVFVFVCITSFFCTLSMQILNLRNIQSCDLSVIRLLMGSVSLHSSVGFRRDIHYRRLSPSRGRLIDF